MKPTTGARVRLKEVFPPPKGAVVSLADLVARLKELFPPKKDAAARRKKLFAPRKELFQGRKSPRPERPGMHAREHECARRVGDGGVRRRRSAVRLSAIGYRLVEELSASWKTADGAARSFGFPEIRERKAPVEQPGKESGRRPPLQPNAVATKAALQDRLGTDTSDMRKRK